ncbi:methyltransferase domain-containing protein [Ostreiculturibacter nitratireducens]|uniref:methyltransferase domain-containing protein n=1 Tax=Ostreiculturibacter nitratireducens TaxID=3075226 RepID=UPI0031B5A323
MPPECPSVEHVCGDRQERDPPARAGRPCTEWRILFAGPEDFPFEGGEFDAAAMAPAIDFTNDTSQAVAELARGTKSGGGVSTCIRDIEGGGFTMEPIREALGTSMFRRP